MVHELERGENVSIEALSRGTTRVEVGLGWEVDVTAPSLDADAFAVLVGADGQALSDAHLVFYNNPESPTGAARLSREVDTAAGEDRQRLALDLAGMPPEVERVVVGLAVYADGRDDLTLAQVDGIYLRVLDAPADGPVGDELARFAMTRRATIETATVLGEVYRYGDGWKVVAVGEGYASGLRGVVTELGVHV